jgi:DNA-binding response OmpR family regulator
MPAMLIADDNRQITRILAEFAKREGFHTEMAYDGEETLKKFHNGNYDIILLDVMMPKKDGFAVCREIRTASNVPILMITARGEDFERIMGLDIGADDYIVKPFSTEEVMARVRAVLRRIEHTPENAVQRRLLTCGTLAVSLDDCHVSIADKDIPLTRKELDLLWLLLNNKGKVFSRDHLLNSLWGYDYFGDNRTIDSHIKRLRAKLDTVPHDGWQIKTIWGVGYSFEEKLV